MSKVEEVARAIYEGRNGAGCLPWARRSRGHREPYLADARAAIEAMGNPSDELLAALAERMHDARFSKSGEDYPIARNFIRAFVDAALREEGR